MSRAAHALAGLGVAAGDRVEPFLPSIPEFPVACLAALEVGAIALSVDVMLLTEELRYVLADAGVEATGRPAGRGGRQGVLPEAHGPYKVPRQVQLVAEILRNATGKLPDASCASA